MAHDRAPWPIKPGSQIWPLISRFAPRAEFVAPRQLLVLSCHDGVCPRLLSHDRLKLHLVPVDLVIGLVDQPPCSAKHLFVAAMVAWVHPGLRRIGKSGRTAGRPGLEPVKCSGAAKAKCRRHYPWLPRRSLASRRLTLAPPPKDLLLCAKHLFVAAMVAWVHPGPAGDRQISGLLHFKPAAAWGQKSPAHLPEARGRSVE